jgi:hypothetical protein
VAENDELRAAAERLRLHNESRPWEGRCTSPYAIVGDPSGRVLDVLNLHRDQGLLADAYLVHPPLTRERVEAAVRELFVNGNGDKATRLVLVDDTEGYPTEPAYRRPWDLGGLCQEAVVSSLCRWLGVTEGE